MRRYDCAFLGGLTVYVCIFIFTTLCLAAEFSADMDGNQIGRDMKGKVYIKGDRVRMEGMSPEGEVSVAIMDVEKGTMCTLIPKNKVYIEMSGLAVKSKMNQFASDKKMAEVSDKNYLGTEDINGYLCDKYEYIYHDKSQGTMTQWFSKKLNYPIKMISNSPYGETVIEYKNITEGGISDSLFEIPAGYQKMVIPGMGAEDEY
ncbi:MAG: hypothetical protein A2Z72_03085 [Omnitrophica bacterium RBG_13_46_9]|nr:MAG: hypothetical protein A2Z72_03085 [Omnitrophica bacterium RBG_13_46_9]